MKLYLAALLPVALLAGCAFHSHPCPVPVPPAPRPVVAMPQPEPAPVVEVAPPAPTPQPEVAPQPAPTPAPVVDESVAFNRDVQDVYFDFDKATIRLDAQTTLTATIAFLRAHPNVTFSIISSCDVRGTSAYNVKLGQRRVDAVHAVLATAGVDGQRTVGATTVGKTTTYCTASTAACYQLNRRVHFVFVGQ
jgi:peptidoglycan-associated lipoprotein